MEKDNPTRHRAYLMYALMGVNVVVGVLTLVAGPSAVYRDFGFVPDDPTWLTLFTSMFLHGSLWHLLGNMFFLWIFGDNVEDVLGPVGFLAVYLLSGMAAAGAHLVMNGAGGVPLIGASGAISGILGVYLAFFPKMPMDLAFFFIRWEVKTFHVSVGVAVGAWFGEQLLFGWVTAVTGLDHYVPIAFWAHVGGLLAGVLLGEALVRLGYIRRYTGSDGRRNPLLGYVRRRSVSRSV